jgi:pyridoxine 4-dehydrogenase
MSPEGSVPSTFAIAGELTVHRLGFGAMRLREAWGEPGPDASSTILREAVRLGIDFIDTARAYGRSEELIADALHPYPEGLVIATKGGLGRGGIADGRPEKLRADCEQSLRTLRLETIDLWQLHRVDPEVPLEEQLGTVRELRHEGKIRFVGLSEVSLDELARAGELLDVATVQNRFSLVERDADDVVDACEADRIGFMPWAPVARGEWGAYERVLSAIAARHGATPVQIALAWLLRRSPAVLPIPGCGSLAHLRENAAAAALLDAMDDDVDLASLASVELAQQLPDQGDAAGGR